MKIIESFKEDISNSWKEKQENTGKQTETLKVETNESLKEIHENKYQTDAGIQQSGARPKKQK